MLGEASFIAEVPGRFAVNVGKLLCEIADGIKTHNGRNLLDLQIGMPQIAGGLATAFLIQKGDKGHAHFLAELMGNVIREHG